MFRGFFIAIEGIDGAGLSTHTVLLGDYLSSKGYNVVLTKEPTDGLVGGLIRAALRGEWKTDPRTLQLLFAADRSHHLENYIKPALKEGKVVITDRYLFSSLAYGSLNLDYDWLKKINSKFLLPDVTIILDVDPQEALRRIRKSRFGFELFEELEKLTKVRETYKRIAKEYSAYIVNTFRSIDEVHKIIIEIVEKEMSIKFLK